MQESAKPFQMLRWKSIRLRCTRQYALETGQPLLARGLVDGERQMARAQHGRAIPLLIEGRTA